MNSTSWEHGSDFHWPEMTVAGGVASPWQAASRTYSSGRDALCALVSHGMAARGWRRLWVPSYYCQRVVAALATTGIEMAVYPDAPMDPGEGPEPDLCRPGDVLLWVNTLGLRTRHEMRSITGTGLERIEDHTHDPWAPLAVKSWSDWCVASLRKTLPLPDGGVLWSPRGHPLPPEAPVTESRRAASLERLGAMTLKQLHLSGAGIPKETYRELAAAGESAMGDGSVSGMTPWSERLLSIWPVPAWRQQRWCNYALLAASIRDAPGIRVAAGCYPPPLTNSPKWGRREQERCAIPFGVVLVCRSAALAALLRRGLAAASVFTDRLWPLEEPVLPGVPAAHRDFSRRMLLLHCDMRYRLEDMTRVAAVVRRLCAVYRAAAESGA